MSRGRNHTGCQTAALLGRTWSSPTGGLTCSGRALGPEGSPWHREAFASGGCEPPTQQVTRDAHPLLSCIRSRWTL